MVRVCLGVLCCVGCVMCIGLRLVCVVPCLCVCPCPCCCVLLCLLQCVASSSYVVCVFAFGLLFLLAMLLHDTCGLLWIFLCLCWCVVCVVGAVCWVGVMVFRC